MAKRIFISAILIWAFGIINAQTISMQQDSTLNNLVLPAGLTTCKTGALGKIKKYGSGKQSMILIPGIGFGESIFKNVISYYKKSFTIYSITPAGFENTSPPPMPDDSVKYSAYTWTNGIVFGVLDLIEKEKLSKPVIIAHFVTATQVALELELHHSSKIGKVIIISGSPYRYYASQKNGQWNDWDNENKLTPLQRENLVEKYWAPQWFKTVTKKTWDDNMWTPDDYCRNSKLGESLFNASAGVPVEVMIRYTLEWMAYDENENFKKIINPTLILIPDFKELLYVADTSDIESCKSAAAKQYLKYFHQQSWQAAINSGNPLLKFETVPGTRIFTWFDNPEMTFQLIDDFLNKESNL